jgi:UTP--glucose-1-phosphate uridylyltransferase
MKPTTAVIFAAGSGTRMLPITAAVQKELLPILNRPVVDYTVTDCVVAGITRIIFVIRPGQSGLQNYYLGNAELEATLRRLGKTSALATLDAIHAQATFEFIEQPPEAGYGTAIPLQVALPMLSTTEPVLVCGGDDFVWRADGTSETSDFCDAFRVSGGEGAIMALEVHESLLRQYGVLTTQRRRGTEYLSDIVEKPAPGEAPSRLINLAKYILTPQLFEFVERALPRPGLNENYLTDAVVAASQDNGVVVHRASGTHLDTGTIKGWLHANEIVASDVAL